MDPRDKQTRFAPVAPIQILKDLLQLPETFGDYHLFLAHHTVENSTEFGHLISEMSKKRYFMYRPVTIIMDNSIVELGGSVDDHMIKEAVLTIQGNDDWDLEARNRPRVIPVLPDVMGDGESTISMSKDAYHRWAAGDEPYMPSEGYMLVTQGKDWEDFTKLVDYFFIHQVNDFLRITWVGIPRKLTAAIGSRQRAVNYIKMVAPYVKIHLLGFSDNMEDDFMCARSGGVTGIDSAVPVRYNALLTPTTSADEIGPRPPLWMESGMLTGHNINNIQNCKKWVAAYA